MITDVQLAIFSNVLGVFLILACVETPLRLMSKAEGLDVGQTFSFLHHLVHLHGIGFAFALMLLFAPILAMIKAIVCRKLVRYDAVILALPGSMKLDSAFLQKAGKHGLVTALHAGGKIAIVLFGDVQIQ